MRADFYKTLHNYSLNHSSFFRTAENKYENKFEFLEKDVKREFSFNINVRVYAIIARNKIRAEIFNNYSILCYTLLDLE